MGGDVLDVEVSAILKTNLDKLEEAISLQAEILDLKSNPTRSAEGTIIESRVEPGRGPVATIPAENPKALKGAQLVYDGNIPLIHGTGMGSSFYGTEGRVECHRGRIGLWLGDKFIAGKANHRQGIFSFARTVALCSSRTWAARSKRIYYDA